MGLDLLLLIDTISPFINFTFKLFSINEFFSLENWDFGDSFYFTELSTFVTLELAPDISNFIIVPKAGNQSFGSLFEISSESDEIPQVSCHFAPHDLFLSSHQFL